MECKDVFVEVFALAEPWGKLGEQDRGSVWQFLPMASSRQRAIWPCYTTHGTSVLLPAELVLGCHSHLQMVPLAQNFLCSFKELVCKGISGFICLSLVVDLFVTCGRIMANLMPLQDLFLEWSSYSFFLCRYKCPHCGGIPKCLLSTSWHGPNRKPILMLSARTCSPGQYFQNKKLTFLDPKQGIFLPNSAPCFVPSCMPCSPARMNLSWV